MTSRTHRERKEQYIKALELEIARLREAFVSESAMVQNTFEHQKALVREAQQENILLREILNSRGVAFEIELQQRKNALGLSGPSPQTTRGLSPSYSAIHSASPFGNNVPPAAPPSQGGMSEYHHGGYTNGSRSVVSGHSPGAANRPSPGSTHHSNSPPEVQEMGHQQNHAVLDTPGIFEKEPQLGIDFILA